MALWLDDARHRRARVRAAALAGALIAALCSGGVALASWSATKTGGPLAVSTATLAAPTSLSLSGAATVTLSWTATTSGWASGTQILRSSTSGGPYTQIAQITGLSTTTYNDTPGTGNYYYVVRGYYNGNGANWTSPNSNEAADNKPYFFKATSGNTATNCLAGSNLWDLPQNYTPSGTGSTVSNATTTFCSATFAAGASLAAGTSTISGYFDNTSASKSCTITYTLYQNGSTSLGTGSATIPANTSTATLFTTSFPSSATTFATGDRLNLALTWTGGGCAKTTLHFDGSSSQSQLATP